MGDTSHSRRAPTRGCILAALLTLTACDALKPAPEPEQTVAPAKVSAPARVDAPEKPAAMPVVRRPVVPGYLAPADGAKPPEPKPPGTSDARPDASAKPAWEQKLDEANALGASGRWDAFVKKNASENEAFALIRALPADDPRFVEAQCTLARRKHVGAEAEAATLAAIARLRAHPPADNYAFLDRDDLLTTELHATIADDGAVRLAPQTILTSEGDCTKADVAMLTMMLIESYHSFAMFEKAYAGTPPPAVPDAFRAASQTLLDLHAELVRQYGGKHPRPAALVERLYWACHWSQRKQHPKICYLEKDERKAFEQALAAREATHGEDHPLTRASLLRVGAARLAEDKLDLARALLTRASAGELTGENQATAAAALALLALQAGKTDEGLALFARIEANSGRIYGDDWSSHSNVLQLYASALRAARRYPEALRVFRKFIALMPSSPGSKPLPWPGFAELLAAAGEHDEALEEFERRIAYAVELEQTGANAPARQMGRDQHLADLRARAEVRRTAGDTAGADADLAEARKIEQGPPVPPDP